jgi:hypothetical protein
MTGADTAAADGGEDYDYVQDCRQGTERAEHTTIKLRRQLLTRRGNRPPTDEIGGGCGEWKSMMVV